MNHSGATGMDAQPATHQTPANNNNNDNNLPLSDESKRSRKPANTKFKQQQLPAWQPMLTARSVLPFLVAIGLAFIPIGIALYLSANNVTEVQVEYTDCNDTSSSDDYASRACSSSNHTLPGKTCHCVQGFTLPQAIAGPVFMYYGLDNFYQNHRKYVKSRDDTQLMGQFSDRVAEECAPFSNGDPEGRTKIAPCGAVANSLFNDTISLSYLGPNNNQNQPVGLLRTGIAWNSDKGTKFKNPKDARDPTSLENEWKKNNLVKPRSWQKQPWELDPDDFNNTGLQNEDFIVWMRTAAFPSFRKLYRRIDHNSDVFRDGLPAGNYNLDIGYNFPVAAFDGRKYVIISSISWIGGRNIFLGVAYMTVGSCCLVLAAIFFFIHIRWGKRPSDQSTLTPRSSW